MTQKTNRIRIPIGDWSDDGHGKFENYDFEVPAEFTKEVLVENYNRNKERFNFGLAHFAQNYEDSTIPKEKWDILVEAGFDPSQGDFDASETEIYLALDDMFLLAMFFIGHGLEGFAYQMAPNPDFHLFGMWHGPETGIGYGLFY